MKNPIPKEQPDKFEPFIYPSTKKLILCKEFKSRNINFLDVIYTRRSSTQISFISLSELSELLFYCNRIIGIQVDESGFWITKRTAPSAGACHPIDLLVSSCDKSGTRDFSYYNPIDHSLNILDIHKSRIQNFYNEININIPITNASIIWFSIQTGKTSSKYENPESLFWRDAGALIYCIQIVATYLGIKSCPFGTLAAQTFVNLFSVKDLLSGGGILVGK